MPRIPKLRRHATGQAHARIGGKDYYFGVWPEGKKTPPEAARVRYEAILAEWLSCGRSFAGHTNLTITQLIAEYWLWAAKRYETSPTELRDIKHALPELRHLYSHASAYKFSLTHLEQVRYAMIQRGLKRIVINHRIDKIKRLFKWAASRKLIPQNVWHDISLLESLKPGQSKAKESQPIGPPDPNAVTAALRYVSPQVAAMIQLQRWTGMRPGEVCKMQKHLIDITVQPWTYRIHFKRKLRTIPLGPKATFLLSHWMNENHSLRDYLFSPREAEQIRRSLQAARRTHARRKSTIQLRVRRREPGPKYTVASYARAIARACRKAGVKHWHPHQLRHEMATRIQLAVAESLAAAQAVLEHTSPQVTQIYAHASNNIAAALVAKHG
jgi:integrase